MLTKITYGKITKEISPGYIATLPCKDLKMESDVIVEAPDEFIPKLQEKIVTPKEYAQDIVADEGNDGLSLVRVNAIQTETKSVIPAKHPQSVVPSKAGKYITEVVVQSIPPEYIIPTLQEKTADPKEYKQEIVFDGGYDGLSKVSINPIQTETKTTTPTRNSQPITPTEGKYLTEVLVNPIPAEYVIPTGAQSILENGTFDVTHLKTVHIAVPDENNWAGDFVSGVPYEEGTLVVYKYTIYLAIKDTDGSQLPTNTSYWEKLTPNWNDTTDATASEGDVVYGLTFYAGGTKKAGSMQRVSTSAFSSIKIERSGDQKLAITYFADKNSYIPNTVGSTRMGTIAEVTEPNFKEDYIADGVTLFGLTGKHGKKFSGAINITSGLTTISGSYLIDQQKAFDLLQSLTANKTFSVAFGAGSIPNGGDEMRFTSMTFDTTNDWIKYDSIIAFVSYDYYNGGNGFKDYTSHGGTGNGARINFDANTEVRTAFKELFLSIADKLISFTIDNKTYYAVSGWTFADWTQDFTNGLNPDGYFPADKVYKEGSTYIEGVVPYDKIISGGAYRTITG